MQLYCKQQTIFKGKCGGGMGNSVWGGGSVKGSERGGAGGVGKCVRMWESV